MSFKKSGIPILQGLIKREVLLDRLSGVLNYPITILSAPAGCGKTALATQIVQQVNADVVWHTISPYEQDLRVFFRALLKSLEPVVPNVLSLQIVLQQPLEHIVYEVTSFLREYLTQDLLIVIDDWHMLQNPNANRWLSLFLEIIPERCHLFVMGRNVPEINIIQLIATRRILNISQQALFFTESEVYMLAVQMKQENLSSEIVQSIWSRLRGWPVGTILALQPIPDFLDTYHADDIEPSESLFQSISSEMLSQQLPDIQHFLKWTSTGEYFNAELCEDVFNISDSAFLLSDVLRQNLFISQQSGGYRYHQLFRTFLQTHFKLNQPDDFKSAHRRLAGWYVSQNQPDRAIEHFIEADSIDEAVQLAESLVYAYFAQGHADSILQLSQKLQVYNLPMPNLDHAHAQIYLGQEMNLEQAQFYAERSLAHFEEHQQRDSAYDVMITLGDIYQRRGDIITAVNMFKTILADDKISASVKGDALNQLGVAEYYLGNYEPAIQHLQASLAITEQIGGLFNRAKLYQELELVYRDVGNVQQANDCLEKQITLWRKLNNPEQLAMALNNLGYRHYEQGQYALAEQVYQQGLDSISNLLSTRARYYLMASQADLQRDQGLFHEARASYQRALNLIAGKEPYAHIEVLTNLATLYRWQLKYEAAITCAQDAIKLAKQHNLTQRYLLAVIAQWQIRLQPWSVRDIQSDIQQVIAEYPQLESHPPTEFMTLQFRIAVLESNTLRIQTYLQTFTRHHNTGQSIQVFIAELIHNPDLAPIWNQFKHQYSELQTALAQRKPLPQVQPRIVPLTADTHSLHIYTLEVERLRKNNAHIKVAEMYAERVREFLYYFVFMGGGTREEIGRIFWEDKSLDAQKDNFHQTLSRLRAVLGNKIILFDEETDIYQLNPDIQVWCDALQLESFVSEARRLSYANQHAFNLWYQATQLTYGDFLPTFDRTWINQRRRYFHNLSIEAWMGLGNCHQQLNDYRSALTAYEAIESFAPYHEAAYRARMECCDMLGETALVAVIYKGLVKRLANDLQVKPSPQTTALYEQLTAVAYPNRNVR